jgi:4-amino-4-deoxy-L-arabinose transferase-like glycosyltransferase
MDRRTGRSRWGRVEAAAVLTLALAAVCVVLLSSLVLSRRGNLAWDDADYLRRGLADARLASEGDPLFLVPRALDRLLLEWPKPPFLVGWIEFFALMLGRTNIDALIFLGSVVPFALLILAVAGLARWWGDSSAALLALVLLIASPRSLSFGGKVMVETFLALWIVISLALAGLLVARPGRWVGIGLGLATGLALLTKLTALLLLAGALVPFAWWLLRQDEDRRLRWRSAAWAALACLAVAGPWYARNAGSTVRFALFSSRFNQVAEGRYRGLGPGERLTRIMADIPGWPVVVTLGTAAWFASSRGRRDGQDPTDHSTDLDPIVRRFGILTCTSTIASAAVLMVPSYFDTRFLLPLWPALAVVLGGEAARFFAVATPAGRTLIGAGLALGLGTSAAGFAREPIATTCWDAARLIDRLVARHGVATLANVGNIEAWNVCKTGLINELRRSPGDCFVLHDLSSGSAAELKEQIHRFDAVVVLEPPAFPPGFVAGAPGLNRAHRFATERTLRDAGLSRAEGLPVEGLPPMTVYVRKPDIALPGALGSFTRLGRSTTPTLK